MSRRYGWIFAAMIAVLLLLAFFLWPQTPGQIGSSQAGPQPKNRPASPMI